MTPTSSSMQVSQLLPERVQLPEYNIVLLGFLSLLLLVLALLSSIYFWVAPRHAELTSKLLLI